LPEHVFTIIALGHAIDTQTNGVTLFSIVEEIGWPFLPVAVPSLSVVTLWRRLEGEEGVAFVQRTRLVDPSGEEIFHQDQSFRMDRQRHRNLGMIQMVPFQAYGCHRLEIQLRKEDERSFAFVFRYPLDVNLIKEPKSLFDQAGPPVSSAP